MPDNDYTIRTMQRAELDIAIEWAAREGWNPGLHDAACYHAADPNGFLIGLLGDEPIATISVIRYSDAFGFLGFYIVKPEYRGQGYGIRLGRAGMEYLAGCNTGLDGVVVQQENYRKSGFRLTYRNLRYAGHGGGDLPANPQIVPLSSLPFETIDLYDRPFFPAGRPKFTRAWIGQPDAHALGILQNEKLAGYAVMRRCRVGHKIGPLFADSAQLAEELFVALKSRVPESEPIYLDTPEVNPAAVELAERNGMTVSFETARMYTGTFPELPLERTFGVTSFEIG